MTDIGFDFRNTSGFVTDPAGCTYVIESDTYPTTRAGATFGWVTHTASGSRDRDNSVDPRVAGCDQTGGGGPGAAMTFQVDLPAGSYTVHLGIGDIGGNTNNNLVTVKDGATTLIAINSQASNPLWDAAGTSFANAAAWVTGEAGVNVTVAGTSITLVVGDGTNAGKIAHLRIISTSAPSASDDILIRAGAITSLIAGSMLVTAAFGTVGGVVVGGGGYFLRRRKHEYANEMDEV